MNPKLFFTILKYVYLLLLFVATLNRTGYGQDIPGNPFHQVYIIGNAYGSNKIENLDKLKSIVREQQLALTIIYCGDIFYARPGTAWTAKDSSYFKSLIEVGEGRENVSVYFVPGESEWDNSGKQGWKQVKSLEKLVNDIAGKKVFLPSSGCPGPEILAVGDELEIVLLNTPWLLHQYDRPYAPDDECKAMSEEQFEEELEDIIDEAKEKHLLVIGHHPALSNGSYGGRTTVVQHLSPPVIGTFIAWD